MKKEYDRRSHTGSNKNNYEYIINNYQNLHISYSDIAYMKVYYIK